MPDFSCGECLSLVLLVEADDRLNPPLLGAGTTLLLDGTGGVVTYVDADRSLLSKDPEVFRLCTTSSL